uniref:Uncharacterized protein n=1 Tax=Zea mays TaxID=4577 RepID=A0A804QCH5_MAIZE
MAAAAPPAGGDGRLLRRRAAFPGVLPELQVQAGAVQPSVHQQVGPAAPDALRRPFRPHHLARQDLREWFQVEARVQERLLLHSHQAPRRIHRRHQHRLLSLQQRGAPWFPRRDRHGVPGHHPGGALHAADERVRARQRRRAHRGAGDAVPPLVRPHGGLPHLRHPVEPRRHHLLRGRRARPPLRAPHRAHLPGPPHVGLRLHLGRLRLGHRRRPPPRRLPLPALRRAPRPLRRRRLLRQRPARVQARAGVPRGGRAHAAAVRGHALGAAGPHGLLLLQRLPQGPLAHARVLASAPVCCVLCCVVVLVALCFVSLLMKRSLGVAALLPPAPAAALSARGERGARASRWLRRWSLAYRQQTRVVARLRTRAYPLHFFRLLLSIWSRMHHTRRPKGGKLP